MKKSGSPIAKAVKKLVKYSIDSLQITLPCVVTKLNDDSTVNLEVLTKELDRTTGEYNTIELYDIGVDFPASYENAYLRLPVKKGTTGSIKVYDCDISALLDGANETPVEVESPRRHNLDDCRFKPDFQTDKKTIAIDENAEFRNENMSIILHPNGKVEIKGASQEMVAVLSSALGNIKGLATHLKTLVTNLNSATVVTALGASPFTPATLALLVVDLANITADETLINTDKTNLDTMKV